MTQNECQALGQFTCEYPDEISYKEVLKLIKQESEDVVIWEPFEYDPPEAVIENIENTKWSLDRNYPEGKK